MARHVHELEDAVGGGEAGLDHVVHADQFGERLVENLDVGQEGDERARLHFADRDLPTAVGQHGRHAQGAEALDQGRGDGLDHRGVQVGLQVGAVLGLEAAGVGFFAGKGAADAHAADVFLDGGVDVGDGFLHAAIAHAQHASRDHAGDQHERHHGQDHQGEAPVEGQHDDQIEPHRDDAGAGREHLALHGLLDGGDISGQMGDRLAGALAFEEAHGMPHEPYEHVAGELVDDGLAAAGEQIKVQVVERAAGQVDEHQGAGDARRPGRVRLRNEVVDGDLQGPGRHHVEQRGGRQGQKGEADGAPMQADVVEEPAQGAGDRAAAEVGGVDVGLAHTHQAFTSPSTLSGGGTSSCSRNCNS